MATSLETIKTLINSLDKSSESNGVTALDAAVKACSTYGSMQELINDFIAKCNTMKGKSTAQIKNFLKSSCGIDLDNDDTGAITGYDAGSSSTQKNAETIVPEPPVTPGQSLDFKYDGICTLGSTSDHSQITVKLPSFSNENEKNMLAGLYNYWITGSTRLVYDSYNLYFNKKADSTDSSLDYMTIGFDYGISASTLAYTSLRWYTNSKTYSSVGIYINMNAYPNFSWSNGTNASGYTTSYSSGLFDRTFAHEMTHALLATSVSNSINKTLPQFFKEGLAELTHGIDDERTSTILGLVSNTNKLTRALDLSDNSTGTNDCYAAGYMLLRYLGHQMSLSSTPEPTPEPTPTPTPTPTLTPTPTPTPEPEPTPTQTTGMVYSDDGKTLTLTAAYTDSSLLDCEDTVETIDASKVKQRITLWGTSGANLLIAGSKGSYLWGRGGNDILRGGSGVDTFRYYGDEGNDTIENYQSGKDIISIGSSLFSGDVKSAIVSGSDVVFSIGDGLLTVKNGKGKSLKYTIGNMAASSAVFKSGMYIYDSKTNKFVSDYIYNAPPKLPKGLSYNADYTTLTASPAYKSKYIHASDYKESVVEIDGSAQKKKITLYGNSNDNVLKAGRAGSYLWGQAGDDILYGGAGVDNFRFYGDEGNDTVYDYQENRDIISLGNTTYGSLTAATVDGDDVILTIGNGKLTVKGAKGKCLKIIDGNDRTSVTRFSAGTAQYDTETGLFDENAVNIYYKAPAGLAYNAAKTALTGKAAFAGSTIDGQYFYSTVKSISASAVRHGVSIYAAANNTAITGSRYADEIYAGASVDKITVKSGNGDDIIKGGNGTSKLYGGNGSDIITGTAGITYLYGEAGNDTLTGGTGKNYLYGGAGNDELLAGTGYNLLDGGNGSDTLYGGFGTNILKGGNGDDFIVGNEKEFSSVGHDNDVNELYGGAGNDYIKGGDYAISNKICGGAGNDYLISGSFSKDVLKGEAGNDRLYGSAGDTLWGGAGKDTMVGSGSGGTIFWFANLSEMKGDNVSNYSDTDVLHFDVTSKVLDLDALYQNYNLGNTSGKNTISLSGETLTITDKAKRKYTMTFSGSTADYYSGSITLENRTQKYTFNF